MSEVVRCSIIIPVLNESAHIVEQLNALQKWRDAGHEVIVVDGGSQDNSVELARPLVDHVVDSEKGRARQMNTGAAIARHHWLVFLHIDTLFSDTAMDSLMRIFSKKEIIWGRFDVRLSGHHLLFKLVSSLMNLRSRLTGIATGDQVIFVRKTVFEEIGGFPDIALMEDISISRRLRSLAMPYCVTDSVTTSSRRWQEQGVVKTILMMWSLRLRYFFGASPATLAKRYERAPK